MATWYFGKFVFGLTGMVYVYLTYLQKKNPAVCVCTLMKEHLQQCGGQDNVEFCPDHHNSDVTVKKDCQTSNHSLVAVLDQSHQMRPESVSATTMTMTAVVQPPTLAVVHRKPKLQQHPVHQRPKSQQPVHQKPKSQTVHRKQNLNHRRLPVQGVVVHVEPVNQFEKFAESVELVLKKQIEQQIKRPICSCNKLRTKRTKKRRSTTTSPENVSSVCRDAGVNRMEQDFRKTLMERDRLDRTFSAIPHVIEKSKCKNETHPIAWWHTKTTSICSQDSAIFSSRMKPRDPVKHYSSKNYSIRRSNHNRQVNCISRQAC